MLAVFSLSGVYAQKNSVLLFGNSTGYRHVDNDSNYNRTNSSVLFNAGIGYQLGGHVTIGVQGRYRAEKGETNSLVLPYAGNTGTQMSLP